MLTGAGPPPIPHASLNSANLADAIRTCLHPQTAIAAAQIATRMRHEQGVTEAVNSFHRNLPVEEMSCDLLPRRNAVWRLRVSKDKALKLSDRATYILLSHKRIHIKDLEM